MCNNFSNLDFLIFAKKLIFFFNTKFIVLKIVRTYEIFESSTSRQLAFYKLYEQKVCMKIVYGETIEEFKVLILTL